MRVTTKGQVTIPLEIRRELGVSAGDDVEFVRDGASVVVRKALPEAESADALRRRIETWLDRFTGSADPGATTDGILDVTRGAERRTSDPALSDNG
jgi:AbrB family looped-hinge helix DNA binding protein